MRLGAIARAIALLVGVLSIGAAGPAAHWTTREDLVGAWHLVKIDVQGPAGAGIDPFYGSGSEGLLIYDRDGWFSVQIMSAPRPALAVPGTRPAAPGGADAAAKEAALDSYYAYYGTWTFDAASSTVTHHATGALYPSESRATYSQAVQVEGDRMTFTRTTGTPPDRTVQTKTWERVRRVAAAAKR
jgi:hypothetical protein